MKKSLLLLITLFSLFSYTTKAASLPGGSKLFIDASSNNWFVDNTPVALWVWGDGFDAQWIEVINKAPGETNIYVITLPNGTGITGMKMVRSKTSDRAGNTIHITKNSIGMNLPIWSLLLQLPIN